MALISKLPTMRFLIFQISTAFFARPPRVVCPYIAAESDSRLFCSYLYWQLSESPCNPFSRPLPSTYIFETIETVGRMSVQRATRLEKWKVYKRSKLHYLSTVRASLFLKPLPSAASLLIWDDWNRRYSRMSVPRSKSAGKSVVETV